MQYFIFVFYTGLHYLSSGVLAKYSLSIKPSILFLITWGLGMNRAFNCSVTCLQKQKQQRIRWTMSWNFRQFQQVRHSAGSRPWDNDRGGGKGGGAVIQAIRKRGAVSQKIFSVLRAPPLDPPLRYQSGFWGTCGLRRPWWQRERLKSSRVRVRPVLRNPDSGMWEIKLKEPGIPLTIGNQNPRSTDRYWNPVPAIRNPWHGMQNPRLPWISLQGVIGRLSCYKDVR